MILRALTLSLVALTAACADQDDYPRLLPTAVALAEPTLPVHAASVATAEGAIRSEAAILSRADALRRRTDGLRGPVIEPDLQRRLQAAGR